MPSSRDLLQRFRPAGTPGSATATGVPADRRAEAEAELAEIFTALASVAAECEAIRQRAQNEADDIRRRGRERALALVAGARREAQADREAVIAEARRAADESSAEVMAAAHESAEQIRRAEAARRADDVETVVQTVRSRLQQMRSDAGDRAEP